jgi:hypothetical protein
MSGLTSSGRTHHAGDRGSSDERVCQTREEAQEKMSGKLCCFDVF